MFTSINRFSQTSTNGAIAAFRNRDGSPLQVEQIRRVAPSVFAEQKHGSRSERYSYIPTSEILSRLMREGFQPFSVSQGGSRDEEKRGFTKHLVRLRHASQAAPSLEDPTFNEIVLLNSHDGTSSYRMMAGQFRLVCSNGMVVSNQLFQDVRVPHTGDVAGRVLDGCIEVLEALPEVERSTDEMRRLKLSDEEQQIFARAALVVRYDDEKPPVSETQILTPRRRNDAEPALWNTLNRVQENLTQGGLRYIRRNENGIRTGRATTRPVNGIDQNTAVNRALWQLAEEMKALKANA